MDVFLAILVNGLSVGSIYALVVVGFNLLLLVAGVVQFAYPHLVVLSMYVAWAVLEATDGSLVIAIPVAILSGVVFNVLLEPLFRPLMRRGAVNQSFIMAMAIAIMITFFVSRGLNHGVPISFPQNLTGTGAALRFGLTTVSAGQIYTLFGSIMAMGAFLLLLERSKLGRSFRAMSQSPTVARLLGIPVVRTGLMSYAVAGALGGVTAIFLAMALGSASPGLGDALAMKAIAVALFAGLGNLRGGLLGALILGIAESLTLAYLPGDWSSAITFAMIMVVVMVKPNGLFGTRV